MLTLCDEQWQGGVLPHTGGSLAFGRVATPHGWADLLRPTPPGQHNNVDACSSFALIPWSNRVGDGRLRYAGRTWQLRQNEAFTNAIHGAARDYPWQVISHNKTACELEFDSASVVGVNFPWRFLARLRYEVSGNTFTVTTTLRNRDVSAFPAGFGHHPYFQRALNDADDEVLLQIPCSQAFALQNCLPAGPPEPIEPRLDFRSIRPLGDVFIDDCLTRRDAALPIRLIYSQSCISIALTADPLFANIVLYVPQAGKNFFAIEPVTNANDGFTLFDRGISGSGIFVLAPDEEVSAAFNLMLTAEG